MTTARMNVCSHRSTLRDYSFLGTAGICIPSNRHSRRSAGTRGCLHIGTGRLVGRLRLPRGSETQVSQMLLNFSKSSFWKGSESGLEGWGDPIRLPGGSELTICR
jgi:hypothetical protein